jgi:hypothetical protein
MNMAQVINGQVVQTELPQTGFLRNGDSVSGYDLLPIEVLQGEGWLPSEDNKPAYNPDTQYLAVDNYTIQADKVIINYKVVDIVTGS